MADEEKYCQVVDGKLALPYQYFAGRLGSRFIISLRDKKQILGVKSKKTGKVSVPPRAVDHLTFEPLAENMVPVGPAGEITNFTVVRYNDRHLPRKAPFVLALIKLDGADTAMTHIVEGVEPEKVDVGMKVKAVFATQTTNTILDIDHFEPV